MLECLKELFFPKNLKIFEILLPSLSNDFGQVLQRKVGLQFFKKFKLAFLKEQKFWARCSFPEKGNVREDERKGGWDREVIDWQREKKRDENERGKNSYRIKAKERMSEKMAESKS